MRDPVHWKVKPAKGGLGANFWPSTGRMSFDRQGAVEHGRSCPTVDTFISELSRSWLAEGESVNAYQPTPEQVAASMRPERLPWEGPSEFEFSSEKDVAAMYLWCI
jgi:hypothetical protein